MTLQKNVSSKICLIGDGGVGKTSLIGRYVHNKFDDKYLKTIGTKVSSKEIVLDYPESHVQVKLGAMIWDIMGQKAFRSLLQDAYFHGANGIIAVCDLTEEKSLINLSEWIDSVEKIVGNVPTVILANKTDLKNEIEVDPSKLKKMAERLNAQLLFTSAKTGENVDLAFLAIATEMIRYQLNFKKSPEEEDSPLIEF
jgi:small GTP-binding protein